MGKAIYGTRHRKVNRFWKYYDESPSEKASSRRVGELGQIKWADITIDPFQKVFIVFEAIVGVRDLDVLLPAWLPVVGRRDVATHRHRCHCGYRCPVMAFVDHH